MLSVVVDQPNSMAVRERPMPEPAAGEVRVRVRYAGICGSDLHIFHGKNPFVAYPRVIGHEFVGRIDAVGDGVDRVAHRRAGGGRSGDQLRPVPRLPDRAAERLQPAAGDRRAPRRRLQPVRLRAGEATPT